MKLILRMLLLLAGGISLPIATSGEILFTPDYLNETILQFTMDGVGSVFASSGLSRPLGIASDRAGNIYVGNYGNHTITKVTPSGSVSLFADIGKNPYFMSVDNVGNVYATYGAESPWLDGSVRVIRFSPEGTPTLFYTTTNALSNPNAITNIQGLAVDRAGNVYTTLSVVGQKYGLIIKIASDGTPSTFATTGFNIRGMAFDDHGNLYLANAGNGTIDKFTPTGAGSVFANLRGPVQDPVGLAFDSLGNLYVGDGSTPQIVKFTSAGVASVFANSMNGLGDSQYLTIVRDEATEVSGHVYCACDGSSIADASVQIGDYLTSSDSEGSYICPRILPGTYTVRVSGNNYADFTTNLTIPPHVAAITNNFGLTNLTLVINPIFDSTIRKDQNASIITNAIKSAIQIYERNIANPLCITILFSETTDPEVLGENKAARASIPYSQYLADLQSNPKKSPNDMLALASLPVGPGTGIHGNTDVILTAANLAAIGEKSLADAAVAGGLGGGYHGTILLNVTDLNGLQSTAAHEINETLGIGGWGSTLDLSGSYTGQISPATGVGSLDLFRYSGPGLRSFTLDNNATAYFSIDGGITSLVYFNQYGHKSDFGDWGDGISPADGLGNQTAQIQDAYGSGNPSMGANEFIALDVVGYTFLSPPSIIQTATHGGNSFTFGWSTLPGQSYQVQYTTNLSENLWNNFKNPVTASGLTLSISDTNASGAQRFYRVVALSQPAVPKPSSFSPQAIIKEATIITNTFDTRYFLRPHR